MLDHILRQAQAYERRHGIQPNVVFVTNSYYQELERDYPELFSDDPTIHLGFRIAVVSDGSLVHPEVAWLPPRLPVPPPEKKLAEKSEENITKNNLRQYHAR